MTREENLHWIDQEIQTWENERQSKHPIKEALHAARKALKQEPTLEKDGTLIVTTEHYKNVGRVLVQCGTNGALFYQDQDSTTKNDIRDNRVKNELNRVKDELEPTTKNCESCRYYGLHHEVCNYCYKCSLWTEQEPTTKNDLAVDCIDRVELLKAMNTYDKFGNDSNERLIFLSTPALQDRYVPYVHYDEMANCVKGMPTVTPQQPKTGYISIDDVMSVFDDFMRGEVDEEGTETFWEMLKDKAESEEA